MLAFLFQRTVGEALFTAQFAGLTGTYSFDSNGDAVTPMMSIYQVENGQWVYKQRIDAGP